MIAVEEKLIDEITATFHHLRTGKVPQPIPIPDDLPDNEIRQLLTYVNRFLVEFAMFTGAMAQVAQGELDLPPLASRLAVTHSFKALHSNLKHLTWKTQQIAGGDLEQRVDFMGDFSIAFNTMTEQLQESRAQLVDLNQQLEHRNKFIRETFGRYTGDDIVDVLLDLPEGLKLGGEKRQVTLLMSDLRGFTALAERLEATQVVALLNHYLSRMIEIIQRRGGTIDDIIGDAILVVFGAPVAMPDAAQRAVCCALEMQKVMQEVNEHNFQKGWPEIEMGIALHTGETVVGNIGSAKRSKYGVIGQPVNLTARIETFTVGGQVLVSPTLISAVDRGLILGEEVKVRGKGMQKALRCHILLGHEDHPELLLTAEVANFINLVEPMAFSYVSLTDKQLDDKMHPGSFLSLSTRRAIVEVVGPLESYANIMLRLETEVGDAASDLYAKVIRPLDKDARRYLIHFTLVPPAVQGRFQRLTDGIKGP
jgi:adenylate cyclase